MQPQRCVAVLPPTSRPGTGRPGSRPSSKTVSLRQNKVPVYYADDREAQDVSRDLFTKLDTDGSGHLCTNELLQARKVMVLDRGGGGQLARNIGSSDANSDGRVDEMEWHQFTASLYEVMGRKQFLTIVKGWSSSNSKVVASQKLPPAASQPAAARRRPPREQAMRADLSPPRKTAVREEPQQATSSPSVENSQEGGASEAEQKAALQIQTLQRGKNARKKAQAEKQKSQAKQVKSRIFEQKLTTVAEVWDMLTTDRNWKGMVVKLELCDILDLFLTCKQSGLNTELAKLAPSHFPQQLDPEDVSSEEVAHLCVVLAENKDLSEYRARAELAPIKASCREIGDRPGNASDKILVNLRMFRSLLSILSALTRIDLDFVSSHWAWTRDSSRFQLPPSFVAYIYDVLAHKGARWKPAENGGQAPDAADRFWANLNDDVEYEEEAARVAGASSKRVDMSTLKEPFGLNDFMLMAYNGGIVDAKSKNCMSAADLQLLFMRVHRTMPNLLRARAEKRKLEVPKALPKSSDQGLVGCAEFEILIEELWKSGPFAKLYPGPLSMITRLATRAVERPFHGQHAAGSSGQSRSQRA